MFSAAVSNCVLVHGQATKEQQRSVFCTWMQIGITMDTDAQSRILLP